LINSIFRASAFQALAALFPVSKFASSQQKHALEFLTMAKKSMTSPWNVRIEILKGLVTFIEKVTAEAPVHMEHADAKPFEFTDEIVQVMMYCILETVSDPKFPVVRKQSLDLLQLLLKKLKSKSNVLNVGIHAPDLIKQLAAALLLDSTLKDQIEQITKLLQEFPSADHSSKKIKSETNN
jgi:hypothetical protein